MTFVRTKNVIKKLLLPDRRLKSQSTRRQFACPLLPPLQEFLERHRIRTGSTEKIRDIV